MLARIISSDLVFKLSKNASVSLIISSIIAGALTAIAEINYPASFLNSV